MEMNQVRYFLALCDELNFTRAAKRCGVAQPSLTNAIKALEAELRGPLFYRTPAVRLTLLGEAVKPSLASIALHVEEAKRRAARRSGRAMTHKRSYSGLPAGRQQNRTMQ
jgi:LysR family transcriptional regulator, hydrogen peroxide-inducible genes activator